MDSSNKYSISNLVSFLKKKDFEIKNKYSINGNISFLHILSLSTGYDFIISTIKYPMQDSSSIELVIFTDLDFDVKSTGIKSVKEDYKEININGLEDENIYLDPEEADKLLEHYQTMDIDSESTETAKNNMINYKRQLERLKSSVSNLKYKLSIVTSSSFCYITRTNNIDCYIVKKSIPKSDELKSLFIIVELDIFYDKVDSINSYITQVYSSLYRNMNNKYKHQAIIIKARVKQYEGIFEKLLEQYKQKDELDKTITGLNKTIVKINKQENILKKQLEDANKDNSISKTFKIKKLNDDYNKLLSFKDDSIQLMSKLKTDYNNIILNFDFSLFDNIRLFNQVTDNFVKIGVLSKCKK